MAYNFVCCFAFCTIKVLNVMRSDRANSAKAAALSTEVWRHLSSENTSYKVLRRNINGSGKVLIGPYPALD